MLGVGRCNWDCLVFFVFFMKYVNLEKDLCVIWCYGEFDIELVEVIFFVFFIYFCIVVGD